MSIGGERSWPPGGLRCRVRLDDGRRSAASCRQSATGRCISDCCTHSRTGWSSSPPAPDATGRFSIHTRARADHFLPGGGTGAPGWLEALLALAAIHADRGEELFIAPAVRSQARGEKHAVAHTRALWVDIDQPGQLHHLWALLAERPCHLLVESGGGGAHAYWLLDKPLQPPMRTSPRACARPDRARPRADHPPPRRRCSMAGRTSPTSPAKTKQAHAVERVGERQDRPARADPRGRLPARPLPDRATRRRPPRPDATRHDATTRAQSRAPGSVQADQPAEYFEALAGIEVPRDGLVSCPAPGHPDKHPSCSVGEAPITGWCCHSGNCGARGAIYDLASVLLGGPWGHQLRGEQFKHARAYVADVFGELT